MAAARRRAILLHPAHQMLPAGHGQPDMPRRDILADANIEFQFLHRPGDPGGAGRWRCPPLQPAPRGHRRVRRVERSRRHRFQNADLPAGTDGAAQFGDDGLRVGAAQRLDRERVMEAVPAEHRQRRVPRLHRRALGQRHPGPLHPPRRDLDEVGIGLAGRDPDTEFARQPHRRPRRPGAQIEQRGRRRETERHRHAQHFVGAAGPQAALAPQPVGDLHAGRRPRRIGRRRWRVVEMRRRGGLRLGPGGQRLGRFAWPAAHRQKLA